VRVLERVAIVLVSLALAVGLIAVLSGYFVDHDQASVTTSHRAPASAP
jgi:purine-cytosine permease-like protein